MYSDKMKYHALNKLDNQHPIMITNDVYHHMKNKKKMNINFIPYTNTPKDVILHSIGNEKDKIPTFAMNGINIGDEYYKNHKYVKLAKLKIIR